MRKTARVQRQDPLLTRGRRRPPETPLPTPPHCKPQRACRPGGHSEGPNTRYLPELGRENPQRQWYCRSSGGRVGRRQARNPLSPPYPRPLQWTRPGHFNAGWSSPVARQAHNLKVIGSNPIPATKQKRPLSQRSAGVGTSTAVTRILSVPSPIYDLFGQAIADRKQILCRYGGYPRELCPIILGHTKGREVALTYQFGGQSKSGLPRGGQWRCLRLSEVSDVQLRAGPWHAGSSHIQPQPCVEVVDLDVNPASPYHPKRRC
jgi:hypothetical protein